MGDTTEENSKVLEDALVSLAACEQEMDKAELKSTVFRLRNTQPIYSKRRSILKKIPKFWYIVLAENEDFSDYIADEDSKYIECIEDIYVYYPVADSDDKSPSNFKITVSFKDNDNEIPLIQEQEITKEFRIETKDGEEKIVSDSVGIEWPSDMKNIIPAEIKSSVKGQLTVEQKKLYRKGMRSFFSWFSWTGTKPGKEYRNGEELTRLIIDELFPYAVKFYTEAMPGESAGEEDTSEGEELDLSGDETDDGSEKKEDGDSDQQENRNRQESAGDSFSTLKRHMEGDNLTTEEIPHKKPRIH